MNQVEQTSIFLQPLSFFEVWTILQSQQEKLPYVLMCPWVRAIFEAWPITCQLGSQILQRGKIIQVPKVDRWTWSWTQFCGWSLPSWSNASQVFIFAAWNRSIDWDPFQIQHFQIGLSLYLRASLRMDVMLPWRLRLPISPFMPLRHFGQTSLPCYPCYDRLFWPVSENHNTFNFNNIIAILSVSQKPNFFFFLKAKAVPGV